MNTYCDKYYHKGKYYMIDLPYVKKNVEASFNGKWRQSDKLNIEYRDYVTVRHRLARLRKVIVNGSDCDENMFE